MAHVVPDAASAPFRKQVGGETLHRDEQVREDAHRPGGRDLRDRAVGPPDPDAITDRDLDLALAFDGLLEALALRELEEHALLAHGRRTSPARMVEGEVLVDDEVADPDVGEASDEGFDRDPGVLARRDGHAHADGGQQEISGIPEVLDKVLDDFDEGLGAERLEAVNRALRRAAALEVARLEHYLPFLATTASATPFIGLFGTVWGIMAAFHGIGAQGSASLAVVAPGISEALVATAAGLGAAIPAVVGYNYFVNRVKHWAVEMEGFTMDLLNVLSRPVAKAGRTAKDGV